MKTIVRQPKWQHLSRIRPTAGMLGALCDENYGLLLRLAPQLLSMRGGYCARLSGQPPLLLQVVHSGPFTRDVRLNYRFDMPHHGKPLLDPEVLLRLYADTGQVEVLEIRRQQCLPVDGLYHSPGLQQKWRANLFVGRWLSYCLSKAYRFTSP
jgi:uncharacterized protein